MKNTEGKSLRILFSYVLNQGQPVIGNSKAWLGRFGEVGHPYSHPSTKQCNYAYTHPTTKQCNYSVDTSGFATTAQLNEVKTSVSNGKSAIASAITDKGVSTAASADFSTMANNIRSIQVNPPHTLITNLSATKVSGNHDYFQITSSEIKSGMVIADMSVLIHINWLSTNNMIQSQYLKLEGTPGSNTFAAKWETTDGTVRDWPGVSYVIYNGYIHVQFTISGWGSGCIIREASLATAYNKLSLHRHWIYI